MLSDVEIATREIPARIGQSRSFLQAGDWTPSEARPIRVQIEPYAQGGIGMVTRPAQDLGEPRPRHQNARRRHPALLQRLKAGLVDGVRHAQILGLNHKQTRIRRITQLLGHGLRLGWRCLLCRCPCAQPEHTRPNQIASQRPAHSECPLQSQHLCPSACPELAEVSRFWNSETHSPPSMAGRQNVDSKHGLSRFELSQVRKPGPGAPKFVTHGTRATRQTIDSATTRDVFYRYISPCAP